MAATIPKRWVSHVELCKYRAIPAGLMCMWRVIPHWVRAMSLLELPVLCHRVTPWKHKRLVNTAQSTEVIYVRWLNSNFLAVQLSGLLKSRKAVAAMKTRKSQDFHMRDEIWLYLYRKSTLYGTTVKSSCHPTARGSIFTLASVT